MEQLDQLLGIDLGEVVYEADEIIVQTIPNSFDDSILIRDDDGHVAARVSEIEEMLATPNERIDVDARAYSGVFDGSHLHLRSEAAQVTVENPQTLVDDAKTALGL